MKLFWRILVIIVFLGIAGAAIYFLFPGMRNNYPTFAAFLAGALGIIIAPFRKFFQNFFSNIGKPSESEKELKRRIDRLKDVEQELWNRLQRERELHEREIRLYEEKINLFEKRQKELDEAIKFYSDPKKYYEKWMQKSQEERDKDVQEHLGYLKNLYEDMQKSGGH